MNTPDKTPKIYSRIYFVNFNPPLKDTFEAFGGRATEDGWRIALNLEALRTKEQWISYFKDCIAAVESLPDPVKQ